MKEMIILHICQINNDKLNGVSCVVPKHFYYQSKLCKAGLLICNNIKINELDNVPNVFNINDFDSKILNLPEPFNNPDLVIFHEIYHPIFLKLSKQLNKNNIPYIIIPHGSLTKEAQKIKKVKKILGNLLLFNKFVKQSKYIQYLSTNEQIASSHFKNKSFVSGNGMNCYDCKKQKFSYDGLKLIYVGRYALYHKGLDILIDGCGIIKDFLIKNNIILDLFGANGDGIEAVKKMVEKNGLQDLVFVHGPIVDTQKINEILKHDMFIQVSRLEGQPLGIMEAMLLGMPTIVSEGSTFSNIIEKNNCGYVASNPRQVADKIVLAYKNKNQLMKLSQNAYNYAKLNFSWDKISKNTLNIYKKIIKEKKI